MSRYIKSFCLQIFILSVWCYRVCSVRVPNLVASTRAPRSRADPRPVPCIVPLSAGTCVVGSARQHSSASQAPACVHTQVCTSADARCSQNCESACVLCVLCVRFSILLLPQLLLRMNGDKVKFMLPYSVYKIVNDFNSYIIII